MGKPKQLYSDEESSMRSATMNSFLQDSETKSVQTTTHAHTAERFIITCKHNLYRRLDSLRQDKAKWITRIYNIIKYNSTEHSTTQIKRNQAGNKEHHLWVNLHLQNNSKRNRKHPELKDDDMVGFKLNPVLGQRAMSRNGVRQDIELLEIQPTMNILFQV